MARIDIRLPAGEKEWMVAEAAQAGVSLSEFVRRRLLGAPQEDSGAAEVLEDHERRLSRLEEMANL